jgi:hypothetical protein
MKIGMKGVFGGLGPVLENFFAVFYSATTPSIMTDHYNIEHCNTYIMSLSITTLSIMTPSIMTEHYNIEHYNT